MADRQALHIDGKEYVSFATARGYLRCADGTLNLYIAQGRLKAIKVKLPTSKGSPHDHRPHFPRLSKQACL